MNLQEKLQEIIDQVEKAEVFISKAHFVEVYDDYIVIRRDLPLKLAKTLKVSVDQLESAIGYGNRWALDQLKKINEIMGTE